MHSICRTKIARLQTKELFLIQLVSALGGRVAEEIQFNDITDWRRQRPGTCHHHGAQPWSLSLGMSDKLGPIQYGQHEEMMFLGRSISEHRNYSDKVAQDIDEEVKIIVDQAHEQCREILNEHWNELELLANALLEFETIESEQFEALMRGEDPFEDDELPATPNPSYRRPSNQIRNGTKTRATANRIWAALCRPRHSL